MKKIIMNKSIYLLIIFCCLTSCDVWQRVQCRVLDESTNKPIKNVRVLTIQNEIVANTDSNGYFIALNNKENHAFKKQKNIYWPLKFECENYITLEKKMYAQNRDSIILLKRK